jgi:hypothetical protein
MENRLTDSAHASTLTADKPALDSRIHLYELLFEMTTQLLAAQKLDERLLLTLDTLTNGLGYPSAAIALINKRTATLQMRMAVGFDDDEAINRLEMPLDSSALSVAIVHDGRPAWITRQSGEAAAAFLDQLKCDSCLLALPLFGGHWIAQKPEGEFARRPPADDRYWLPESMCLGALYIVADQSTMDEERFNLLARFADRVGIIISAAVQTERLVSTVNKLQRERQWVESIMK